MNFRRVVRARESRVGIGGKNPGKNGWKSLFGYPKFVAAMDRSGRPGPALPRACRSPPLLSARFPDQAGRPWSNDLTLGGNFLMLFWRVSLKLIVCMAF